MKLLLFCVSLKKLLVKGVDDGCSSSNMALFAGEKNHAAAIIIIKSSEVLILTRRKENYINGIYLFSVN